MMSLKSKLVKGVGVAGISSTLFLASSCAELQRDPSLLLGAIGAGAGALIDGGRGAAWGGAIGYGLGNEIAKDNMRSDISSVREDANTEIINVYNSNGSITPVKIKRIDERYIGPRGEIYQSLPTENQLRSVYGF